MTEFLNRCSHQESKWLRVGERSFISNKLIKEVIEICIKEAEDVYCIFLRAEILSFLHVRLYFLITQEETTPLSIFQGRYCEESFPSFQFLSILGLYLKVVQIRMSDRFRIYSAHKMQLILMLIHESHCFELHI